MKPIYWDKTLEELENDYWKDTDFPTGLVERCYLARKKKLKDLTSEDIITLIMQQIGLEYIVPLAITFIKKDIMFCAKFYEGDLLLFILKAPASFWREENNIMLWEEVFNLVGSKLAYIKNFDSLNEVRDDILNTYLVFERNSPKNSS